MLSVRRRKRLIVLAAGVSWVVAGAMVTLSLGSPETYNLRTLMLVALTIAATLSSTSVIISLITGPDVAYRIGVKHGRAGRCHRCVTLAEMSTDDTQYRSRAMWTDN